jgi:hypothetical protein
LQPLDNKVEVVFEYYENQELQDAEKSSEQEIEIYHINDKDEN